MSGAVGAGIGTKITQIATKVGFAMATPTKAKIAAKTVDVIGNAASGATISAVAGTVNDIRLGNKVSIESVEIHAAAGALVGGLSVMKGQSGALDQLGDCSFYSVPAKSVISSALIGETAMANSNGLVRF